VFGYFGQILRVDLTNKRITREKLQEEICKKFLGGAGLAANIIFKEVGPNVDPLSPDNKLVFALGPFNGTNIPGSGRWIVASKSPLTGIWGEACGGGYWGPEFKRTGYDALVIQGKADKPVYLWVCDGEAELKEAAHLWGKDAYETDRIIKNELADPMVRVACIGQAGEKLVKIACIVADSGHGIAARTGLGAIMGSKNLKAVAVRGRKKVKIAAPDRLKELVKEFVSKIPKDTKNLFHDHGTPGFLSIHHYRGEVPVKYWTKKDWPERVEKLGGSTYTNTILVKPVACVPCPLSCHRYIKIEKPDKFKIEGMGPEYETLCMLGTSCLIDDLPAVAKANDMCNRYGIDTISAGGIIGLLMEGYEKRWITKKDTDGIKMSWGDAEALMSTIERIALRAGFGNVLAEGIKATAKWIGKEAESAAVHVKGLDFPGHDPRAFFSMLINYATGNRGSCHLHGSSYFVHYGALIPEAGITEPPDPFSLERKGYIAAKYQDYCEVFDSLVQCKFMSFCQTMTDQVNMLSAVTGWRITAKKLLQIGERIYNLQRAFNVRLGISRKDDILPTRMFEDKNIGNQTVKIPPLEPMLNEYYRIRGWNAEGKPTKEKLAELDLAEASKLIWE